MTDLTQFKTREELHAFYLQNPDAIEFKVYMDLLMKLPKAEKSFYELSDNEQCRLIAESMGSPY